MTFAKLNGYARLVHHLVTVGCDKLAWKSVGLQGNVTASRVTPYDERIGLKSA